MNNQTIQNDKTEVIEGPDKAEYNMGDHGKVVCTQVNSSDLELDEVNKTNVKYMLNAIQEAKYYIDESMNRLLHLVGPVYEENGANLSRIYEELERMESNLILKSGL